MQSNRPEQFTLFLDRMEASLSEKTAVEIIVKIDDDDDRMIELLPTEQSRRPFVVKYICTPLPDGFYGLWRSMNEMLEICDPDVYFVVNLNDEMHFSTVGWDDLIRGYIGYFPDNLFRLRTSNQRHRRYIDAWECGFAPDSAAFITRRWFEVSGNWTPCTGPDTFQQMVAYYLSYGDRFAFDKPAREIAIDGIGVSGEGGSHGMDWHAERRRMRNAIRPWFTLMSYKTRTEAFRRAAKIAARIFADEAGHPTAILQDRTARRSIAVIDPTDNSVLRKFSYRLSASGIAFQNFVRTFNYGYYGGVGDTLGKNPVWNWLAYLCLRFALLDRVRIAIKGDPGRSGHKGDGEC
jgi:hypothetical protein